MPIPFLRGARIDLFAAAAFHESEAEGLSAGFLATVEVARPARRTPEEDVYISPVSTRPG